ncbi:MAG: hypothetical protein CM15mP74_32440 [Halieaceae bacterium]|nr:MAG: hypothetical protein CM15mP74_32440 [Halieaceae bacterium]
MSHRNNVPEWRDLLEQGLIADTIEVSGTWSQIDAIYEDVVAALGRPCRTALTLRHTVPTFTARASICISLLPACQKMPRQWAPAT